MCERVVIVKHQPHSFRQSQCHPTYSNTSTSLEQSIVNAPDAVLIARDGAGREDDDIAGRHCRIMREKWPQEDQAT
jgi:hypothetical protein